MLTKSRGVEMGGCNSPLLVSYRCALGGVLCVHMNITTITTTIVVVIGGRFAHIDQKSRVSSSSSREQRKK